MFKKKSLLILLILVFALLAGTANAQIFDFASDNAFGVYGFAEMGLIMQMAFVVEDEDNVYVDSEAETFVVGLEYGAQSYTPLFAFYPYADITVWEGDEEGIGAIYAYGRIRIALDSGWKASPYYFQSYVAFVQWDFAETAYLYIDNGNLGYKGFGTYTGLYYGTFGSPVVELGFDLEMLMLNISLRGPFGLDAYGAGPSIQPAADGGFNQASAYYPYDFWIEANNIDLDIITLSVGIGYQFYNTFNWDSAFAYGLMYGYFGPQGIINDAPIWLTEGLNVFEKGGALMASFDFDLSMENLLAVGLYNEFYMGMSTGSYFFDVCLMFDLLLVEGLTVNLTTELYMDGVMGTDDIDGYTIEEVDAGYWMPVWLYVSYDLDLNGMTLSPFLYAGADLGGTLFSMDDPQIDRGWFISFGMNLSAAGGYIRIPFEVMITTNPDLGWVAGGYSVSLLDGFMGGGLSGGYPAQSTYAKTYITLGIIFELD